MEQGHFCQQADQTYKESFKLDSVGERDGVLSNKKEPRAADILGTNRETIVKCLKGIQCCSKKLTGPIA